MFSVWFARGYANEHLIAKTADEQRAREIADTEYNNGTADITVEDPFGAVVYEPTEEQLFDEY